MYIKKEGRSTLINLKNVSRIVKSCNRNDDMGIVFYFTDSDTETWRYDNVDCLANDFDKISEYLEHVLFNLITI